LLGIPSRFYGTLLDKLLDYVDIDNLTRINGAERDEYKKANLAEPSNRLLLTVLQTKQLLEWRDHLELWQTPDWLQNTTVASISYPNVNTAPALVLQAVYGLNTEAAQRIVQGRKQSPISWLQQAEELGGMPLIGIDDESLVIYPSTYLRITFWHPALGDVQRLHLYLTPSQEPVPWRVEYAHKLPLKSFYEALPLTHAQTEFFTSTLSTQ
jgi:DNA uptake protein ComE-like DNA-binding protein